MPDDLVKTDSRITLIVCEFEQVLKFPVPTQQAQIAVKQCDALTGMIERMLEQITVVLNGRRSIIQYL